MMGRCTNPNIPTYNYYGAKGIKVCKRWADSFDAFYKDMEASWQPGLQLDRINPYGNYNKKNCQWITKEENVNKPRRKRVTAVAFHYGTLKHMFSFKLSSEHNTKLRKFIKDNDITVSQFMRRVIDDLPVDNPLA